MLNANDLTKFTEVIIDKDTKEYFYSNVATELFDSQVSLMMNGKPIV